MMGGKTLYCDGTVDCHLIGHGCECTSRPTTRTGPRSSSVDWPAIPCPMPDAPVSSITRITWIAWPTCWKTSLRELASLGREQSHRGQHTNGPRRRRSWQRLRGRRIQLSGRKANLKSLTGNRPVFWDGGFRFGALAVRLIHAWQVARDHRRVKTQDHRRQTRANPPSHDDEACRQRHLIGALALEHFALVSGADNRSRYALLQRQDAVLRRRTNFIPAPEPTW